MLSPRQMKDLARRKVYGNAILKARYQMRKMRGLCVKCGQENDRFPHVTCSICLRLIEAPQCVAPGCFRIGKFPTDKGPVCGFHVPGLHMTPEIQALAVEAKRAAMRFP